MIRKLTDADTPTMVAYGEYFWGQSPYATTGMEYSPETIVNLLNTLRKDHYIRVFELEGNIVGFIGVMRVPFVFNPEYTVGQELFFFVHPEHRGEVGKQLLDQAEEDLKDEVDFLALGELRSSKDMEEYYVQRGYVLTERTFSKVI